jgi:hypothetical protein
MQKLCYLVDKPSSDKLYQIFKYVKILQLDRPKPLKGTVSRDFFASDFFHESVSPKPLITVYYKGRFEFFRKFGEIFAA